MAGGYVGVDVFFVISGFLITHLLQREYVVQGRIDWLGFYARRIRRLLPAFALMMAFVMLGLYLLVPPFERPELIRAVMAAALYISNLHFYWQSVDYWADDAKLDPLLHTWSLGVEEQFYLMWPLLLWFMLWLERRSGRPLLAGWLVLGLSLLSLALAVVEVGSGQPVYAFFSPFTRAWEFGAGACLVLFAKPLHELALRLRVSSWWRLHGLLGAMALFVAALAYDDRTAFPGMAALLPVLATAWLVWNGGLQPADRTSLLGHPVLQWLGQRSYGWYLWHWPILVFGRMAFPHAGLAVQLGFVGVALLPAILSYRLLEIPVRQLPAFRSNAFALGLALAVSGITMGVGMQMAAAADAQASLPEFAEIREQRLRLPALYRDECAPRLADVFVHPCRGGDAAGEKVLVLVGDSHAGQWVSAFDAIARAQGWRLLLYTKSACPMVDADYHFQRLGRLFTECTTWRQGVLKEIAAIRPALLVMTGSEHYPLGADVWEKGETTIATALAKNSERLVILRDTPLPGTTIPGKCWQPTGDQSDCSFLPDDTDSLRLDAVHRRVVERLPNAVYLDMTSAICPEQRCTFRAGNIAKFRDSNHLSDAYVRTLTAELHLRMARLGLL